MVSFSVPENSFDYWIDRFANKDVKFEAPTKRFGKPVVENKEEMGKKLFLPPWLEPKRERIEQTLPLIEV
jgi:hypothetical protein